MKKNLVISSVAAIAALNPEGFTVNAANLQPVTTGYAGSILKTASALKTQLDKYINNYNYVVIDNEAGLEHISRGTLPHVDAMLLISDCSRRGIQAVGRIAEMIRELELKPGKMKLIVNRAPGGQLNPGVAEEIEKYGLELIGVLPQDEQVYEYDCEGKPSSQVPESSPVKQALAGIMRKLNL